MGAGASLDKNKISFWRMFAVSMSGIVLYGYAYATSGGFVSTAGRAAIYVGVLGAIVVLLASIPILEYTRLVNFAGGYYGLAELAFGKAVGKFTALANYTYYFFWQTGNGTLMAMLMVVGYYMIFGVLPPIWVFFAIAYLTVIIVTLFAVLHVSMTTRIMLMSVIIQIIVVLASSIYVIARTPYNSTVFLNPTSGPGGFTGIALGASIAGFLTFTGYGNPLFYSEEGAKARKTVWKAIIVAVFLATLVGSVSIYSEIAGVKNIGIVASSPIPLLTAYGPYVGTIGLLFFYALLLPLYYTNLSAGTGSWARLIWAMTRDGFIKSKWINQLNSKKVPVHAAILNLVTALITITITGAVIFKIYGYNENSMFYAGFAPLTAAVVAWYFHHFIPDIGLGFYIRKHKIKVSLLRLALTAVITPAFGVSLFAYAFYAGIISNLVEPYFSFVVAALIMVAIMAIFTVYKSLKNQMGESVVSYMTAEADKGEEL
jgi:amino acid transporter